MARPMVPVTAALCACTLPGEHLPMVAQIDFFEGEVQVRAPESPAIDACLSQLPIRFEPFRPDGPVSDCVGCGPRRYGVLHGSAPVDTPDPPGRIRMAYSFALDRSSEVLSCAPGTHAERGRCEPDAQAIAAPVAATCGCDPANLRCAIDCAAGQER